MGRTDDKARISWGQRGSLIAFDASGLPREGAVQGKMIRCCWEPRTVLTPFLPLRNGLIVNQRISLGEGQGRLKTGEEPVSSLWAEMAGNRTLSKPRQVTG